MHGPVSVGQVVVGVLIVLPIIALGLWGILSARKSRRAPAEVQEARVRDVFSSRPNGRPQPAVGIDLDKISLPQERIVEIATECGYEFDKVVKNRNTNAIRFNVKGSS